MAAHGSQGVYGTPAEMAHRQHPAISPHDSLDSSSAARDQYLLPGDRHTRLDPSRHVSESLDNRSECCRVGGCGSYSGPEADVGESWGLRNAPSVGCSKPELHTLNAAQGNRSIKDRSRRLFRAPTLCQCAMGISML